MCASTSIAARSLALSAASHLPFFWWMYFEFSIHIIYSHYIVRLVVRVSNRWAHSLAPLLFFSEYAINYLICYHHREMMEMILFVFFVWFVVPLYKMLQPGSSLSDAMCVVRVYTQSISSWLGNKQANTLILIRCLFNWPATMQWP